MSFSGWLISLSVMPSRPVHVVTNGRVPPPLFLKILFIYVTETASKRGNTSRGSGRGRSRLPGEEPDVGLNPRTLGSHPELKAEA